MYLRKIYADARAGMDAHIGKPVGLEEFLNVCEKLKENGILPYGANMDFGLTVPVM